MKIRPIIFSCCFIVVSGLVFAAILVTKSWYWRIGEIDGVVVKSDLRIDGAASLELLKDIQFACDALDFRLDDEKYLPLPSQRPSISIEVKYANNAFLVSKRVAELYRSGAEILNRYNFSFDDTFHYQLKTLNSLLLSLKNGGRVDVGEVFSHRHVGDALLAELPEEFKLSVTKSILNLSYSIYLEDFKSEPVYGPNLYITGRIESINGDVVFRYVKLVRLCNGTLMISSDLGNRY